MINPIRPMLKSAFSEPDMTMTSADSDPSNANGHVRIGFGILDEEVRKMLSMRPMPREAFLAWLEVPLAEAWGTMTDCDEVAAFISQLRRERRQMLPSGAC